MKLKSYLLATLVFLAGTFIGSKVNSLNAAEPPVVNQFMPAPSLFPPAPHVAGECDGSAFCIENDGVKIADKGWTISGIAVDQTAHTIIGCQSPKKESK